MNNQTKSTPDEPPTNILREMPPRDIIDAALKVGRWFDERNIHEWELVHCRNRWGAYRTAPTLPRGTTSRPRFVTFTGADEHTSIEGMQALSRQYHVEWGVLFSPKKHGKGRYPPLHFVDRLIRADGLRLSAHLCGGHSRDVIERCTSDLDPLIADGFERAQINSAASDIDIMRINRWARGVKADPILQCRGSFPVATQVEWLFDESGGRGISPRTWPTQHPAATCGYAGGIGPDNVLDVLGQIRATDFWIDMESDVRDEHDRFSLDKCRAVCEAVYGTELYTEAAERAVEPAAEGEQS